MNMNYEALLAVSIVVWRLIGSIRTPVLTPLKTQLKELSPKRGELMHSAIVWLAAFLIGYGVAVIGGPADGDMLRGLGWTLDYPTLGYAMTAIFIASGSAGLRAAEKLFIVKFDDKPKTNV